MDGVRFDAWSRALVTAHSRRELTRRLGGLALASPLAVVGLGATEAKHKHKKKKLCG